MRHLDKVVFTDVARNEAIKNAACRNLGSVGPARRRLKCACFLCDPHPGGWCRRCGQECSERRWKKLMEENSRLRAIQKAVLDVVDRGRTTEGDQVAALIRGESGDFTYIDRGEILL